MNFNSHLPLFFLGVFSSNICGFDFNMEHCENAGWLFFFFLRKS